MQFCNDVDLLHWEPNLLKDAAFASQQLDSGTGDLAGTTFTLVTGMSFVAQKIEAGQVIVLGGAVAGSFAITQVLGLYQLKLSVIWADLFPGGPPPDSVALGTASGLTYVIRSFWAQRQVVSDFLLRAAGIGTDYAAHPSAAVINTAALRRPCILGTLQMIYSALAAAAVDPTNLAIRANLYERMYRRSLRQTRVEIDLDGDGAADTARALGAIRMSRE